MTTALAILGASGKMGKRILQLAEQDPQFHIVGLGSRSQLPELGSCDVAIDFTSPEATRHHLEAALRAKKPLVIGTTGHSPEQKNTIEKAAATIPILYSPNFSFGIALCLEAAMQMGKRLFGTCKIDIYETHHIHKKDRPSGTALAFAKAVGNGDIHSVRSGEVVGEHTVVFECGHERIELKHTAHSRDAFAHGALMGAKFLVKQAPGLYSLKDLFSH